VEGRCCGLKVLLVCPMALLLQSKHFRKMAVFWVVAPCSLKRCQTSTRLHGATTQKTAIFVLTAVRTSNPKRKTGLYSKWTWLLRILRLSMKQAIRKLVGKLSLMKDAANCVVTWRRCYSAAQLNWADKTSFTVEAQVGSQSSTCGIRGG
jgi:hypothetical protein